MEKINLPNCRRGKPIGEGGQLLSIKKIIISKVEIPSESVENRQRMRQHQEKEAQITKTHRSQLKNFEWKKKLGNETHQVVGSIPHPVRTKNPQIQTIAEYAKNELNGKEVA